MVLREATRKETAVRVFLSAANLLAVGFLAYGFLNEPVRTFLYEEIPYALAVIGLLLFFLFGNAILLGLSAFIKVALGRFSRFSLMVVNLVGTCVCVYAAYAAFDIRAVWGGTLAVGISAIFITDLLFLRSNPSLQPRNIGRDVS